MAELMFVSFATQAKVEQLEQQIADLQSTVAQLSAQLGDTSFVWGSAQDYLNAGQLPVGRMFVVVDTVENLGALAQEYDPETTTHAYTIVAGADTTP